MGFSQVLPKYTYPKDLESLEGRGANARAQLWTPLSSNASYTDGTDRVRAAEASPGATSSSFSYDSLHTRQSSSNSLKAPSIPGAYPIRSAATIPQPARSSYGALVPPSSLQDHTSHSPVSRMPASRPSSSMSAPNLLHEGGIRQSDLYSPSNPKSVRTNEKSVNADIEEFYRIRNSLLKSIQGR